MGNQAFKNYPPDEGEQPGEKVGTGEKMNAGGHQCRNKNYDCAQQVVAARQRYAKESRECRSDQKRA